MKRLVAALLLSSSFVVQAQNIWINEFHYDNTGSDVGEFVEVVAPTSFTDLASVTITLYNGLNGLSYNSYLLSSFTTTSVNGDFTVYSRNATGMQNDVEGISLDLSGTLLQFISYEGSFVAQDDLHPAALGQTSVDIGVSENGTQSGTSLGLIGTGNSYASFTWVVISDDSPGAVNGGQTLSPIPEPQSWLLLVGGLLGLFAVSRRRR